MVSNNHEIDEILQNKLSLIESTPARNPEKAARGREDFMSHIKELQPRKAALIAAQQEARKPQKRIRGLRPSFSSVAAAITIALVLLLGSTWGTVYAAQDSLPGDFLYSVKLAEENLRLTLTADPTAKINLLVAQTDRRVDEAVNLISQGQPVPESLPVRMETQLDEIFTLVANLDDAAMSQALSGIQIHLRDQDRDMTHAMAGLPEGVDPQLTRLQSMLQARQQLAATGIEEPNIFRHQFRNQENKPEVTVTAPITPTLTITSTITVTPEITTTLTVTTTIPGQQYGPGPCDDPGNCLPPGDGPGPGPFDDTPTPPQENQGYGPGSDEGVGPNLPLVTPKPEKDNTKSNDNNGQKGKP
jgi:hypothetical protein